MQKTKWYVYTKRADFDALAKKFNISPVIARILRNRDIISDEDIDITLNGSLKDLYDERLMPDMEKAALEVIYSVRNHERIRVVGDYDIDGVCATYILMDALKNIGANIDYCIPDRINDGYGININIIRKAASDKVDLILTCDNGIAAIEEAKEAKRLGLKMIITDHHSVRKDEEGHDILPKALAVVDVKREDSLYPSTECCGTVTAWKLIKRIYKLLGYPESEWLKYLEFASLSTIGDIMTLTKENRIIVKEGLKCINNKPLNLGLRALILILGLEDKKIDTYHIGFIIGPSINASGRLESADIALRLFMSKDMDEALDLAKHMKELNLSRKLLTEKGVKEGMEKALNEYPQSKVLVIFLESLHESLAGIVAGRIKDQTGKPCICITRAKEGLKGSGRSIENYDMFSKISEADKYLSRYGGHKMAAGMSLKEENLEPFRAFLNEHSDLKDEDLLKKIWIDVPLPLIALNYELINEIESLSPFGNGFERPLFADRDIFVSKTRVLGKAERTLKMTLRDVRGHFYNGIMFGDAKKYESEIKGRHINILYVPSINDFHGEQSVEIQIKDYALSDN